MKDKLTSADPAGWYLCNNINHPVYWDGIRLFDDGVAVMQGLRLTNFARLVEYVEPEVIEGDGVKVLPKGTYWRSSIKNDLPFTQYQNGRDRTDDGARYIRIPDPQFPPRKPTLPPKPELVLVWLTEKTPPVWAFDRGDEVEWSLYRVTKESCWKVEGAK